MTNYPPIWRDDGTSVVVGRKRAYPVDLAHCRVRLQVAGLSWVSKAGFPDLEGISAFKARKELPYPS